jgi:Cytidylate kinase-like family
MSAGAARGRGESAAHHPVVTLAAIYGAGGSVVGPRVAERLGVPLLDREIPENVARWTGLPEEAISDIEEKPRSGLDRLAATLGRASIITGGERGQMSGWISRSAT